MLTAWLLVGVGLVLIALSGVFVAAEFSFVTVSRTAVERAVADKVGGAAGLQTALRSLSTQLSAAQVGITITGLLIGWVTEPSVATLVSTPLEVVGVPEGAVTGISLTFGLLLAAALTMVFGELVPQYLALAHPFGVARIVQAPQRWFTTASRPLTALLNGLANRVVRLFGVEPREELASARSPEELVSIVRSSAEMGHLAAPTASLVERSLRFDDLQARDALTPRTRLVAVEARDPVQRVLDVAVDQGLSRFPVTGKDLDDIVGVVELSHAVGIPPAKRTRVRVREVATEPLFVPHTAPLDDVLWELRDRDMELAVVLDEYGGTSGIVTLEDLVEEIVGEVDDEHDAVLDVSEDASGDWTIPGLLRPDEVDDLTGIRLPDNPQRYETVAGLVLYRLGRIPAVGDEVDIDGVLVRVVRMDGHRIDQVKLHWTPPPSGIASTSRESAELAESKESKESKEEADPRDE